MASKQVQLTLPQVTDLSKPEGLAHVLVSNGDVPIVCKSFMLGYNFALMCFLLQKTSTDTERNKNAIILHQMYDSMFGDLSDVPNSKKNDKRFKQMVEMRATARKLINMVSEGTPIPDPRKIPTPYPPETMPDR